jgi:hypothetical protein
LPHSLPSFRQPRLSRQALLTKSSGLVEHIAMALLLVGKAVLCELQLGGSTLRGSLDLLLPGVVVHSRNRTLGPLPLFTKR